jgi:ferredoxin
MANQINDECIQCGACEPECPNQAITNADGKYSIDATKCDECAKAGGDQRCKSVCPAEGAILTAG